MRHRGTWSWWKILSWRSRDEIRRPRGERGGRRGFWVTRPVTRLASWGVFGQGARPLAPPARVTGARRGVDRVATRLEESSLGVRAPNVVWVNRLVNRLNLELEPPPRV